MRATAMETTKADMLADASQSIRMVFEPSRTDLRIDA